MIIGRYGLLNFVTIVLTLYLKHLRTYKKASGNIENAVYFPRDQSYWVPVDSPITLYMDRPDPAIPIIYGQTVANYR